MNVARALLVSMVVLGALLSFSLEPLIGRLVAPSFGGAIHVWTVCVMTFQGLLLLGYLYAHLLAHRIAGWHLAFLALPLLWLPIGFSGPPLPEAPIVSLIVELLGHVAIPFLALCTSAVVAQVWLARTEDSEPYPLYAASNIGSLLALLCYPFLVEPFLGLQTQRWIWSAGYVVFLGIVAATWWVIRHQWRNEMPEPPDSPRPTLDNYVLWVALSAVPSALMLAITNLVAAELGSFPLLWVIPLALYLGSFVVGFRPRTSEGFLVQFWPDMLLLLGLLCNFVVLLPAHPPLYLLFFFVCLLIHEQLYVHRPKVKYLTHFYIAIALGGWLGGIAVSLVAPVIFNGLYEVPVCIVAAGLVMWWASGFPELGWWRRVHIRFSGSRVVLGLVVVVLLGLLAQLRGQKGTIHQERNFYGIFQVNEQTTSQGEVFRDLISGSTSHGAQYQAEGLKKTPMSYYHPLGANRVALDQRRRGRMAGIGLGTGAIAAGLAPGEELVFYEVNPHCEQIAREWFSYLHDTRGEVEVRLGDARLLLEVEGDSPPFDTIFVDAFSGDGIPTHLLTIEAFNIYLSRLSDEGLLVLHISNRYYDLRGVVKSAAQALGLAAVWHADEGQAEEPLAAPALTVALARSSAVLAGLEQIGWASLAGKNGIAEVQLWTDDYVNILAPIGARTQGQTK
ncbi:MAG: fused MFS/spermidine synthase [Proteobacteria bacterium]|jgi:spermidine synthase|nr:fused MFS/spermidine synthase [Pseudomonadota bacterium]